MKQDGLGQPKLKLDLSQNLKVHTHPELLKAGHK